MNRIRVIVSASIISLIATGSLANGSSKSGPVSHAPEVFIPAESVPAQRFNWTGAYAGVFAGIGSMSFSDFSSRSGANGGLFLGYRQDLDGLVVGAELLIAPTAIGSANLPGGDEIKAGATLVMTAGMPITADRRTLGSVGAGPAVIRTSGDAGSKNSTGVVVGAGIDHMLTDTTMLRGGINYYVINNVSNANLKTRTMQAGLGIAFKF